MIRYLLAFVLLACSTGAAPAEDTMLYVEYRVISPQSTFAGAETEIRKLWLAGSKYMRFEDIPNPQTNAHILIVVAEPDIWVIDRVDNEGQHRVDPGPNYAVHFPMLSTEQSPKLQALEFGMELEFFRANGAKQVAPQVVDGVTYRALRLEMEERELTLLIGKDSKPFQVSLKADNYLYSVRIVKYEPNLKPDFSLFKVPPNVRIK